MNSLNETNRPLETLLLVDGLNIVRRVYEANPAPDSVAKAEGCIRSSLSSIQRALSTHQPSHAAIVFDHGGRTWKHDLYAGYMQDRKPMPQVLRDSLPALKGSLTQTLGVHQITVPGVEADDVLWALSKQWLEESLVDSDCVVTSTDKDLHILIDMGVRLYHHFDKAWHDADYVRGKFLVEPGQLADYLALMGDASDGIPGVDGVGHKTAAKLLADYGTLDNVLLNAANIKGKVGANLLAQSDLARLSRTLVSFKEDCYRVLDWNAMARPLNKP